MKNWYTGVTMPPCNYKTTEKGGTEVMRLKNIQTRTVIAAFIAGSLLPAVLSAQIGNWEDNPANPLAETSGDASIGGDLEVNGSIEIAPAVSPGPVETIVGTPGGAPRFIDNGDGTFTVITLANEVGVELTQTTAGGVLLDSQGNGTFTAEVVEDSEGSYFIYNVETFDNNTLLPVANPVNGVYAWNSDDLDGFDFAVATDPAQNPVAGVAILQPDPNDEETWVLDPADPGYATAIDNTLVVTGTTTQGGDVSIGGDLAVEGTLAVGAVADVETELSNLAADIDDEEAARIAADNVLQANIDAEEAARIAADDVLQTNIDAEEAARIAEVQRVDDRWDDRIDGQNFHAAGADSFTLGGNAIAIGQGAEAHSTDSIAIGRGARAINSVAIGAGAQASGLNTTAIGDGAIASGNNSVALGAGAQAVGQNSVALGAGTIATRDNSVSVGGRVITDVAAGTQGGDAVNVNQLNVVSQAVAINSQRIDLNSARIDRNATMINQNRRMINENRQMIMENRQAIRNLEDEVDTVKGKAYSGIAAAAAIGGLITPTTGRTTLSASVAHYEGESAVGLNAVHRIDTAGRASVYLNIGGAATTDDTALGRFTTGVEF